MNDRHRVIRKILMRQNPYRYLFFNNKELRKKIQTNSKREKEVERILKLGEIKWRK